MREEVAAAIAEAEAEAAAYQAGIDQFEREQPLSTSLEVSRPASVASDCNVSQDWPHLAFLFEEPYTKSSF